LNEPDRKVRNLGPDCLLTVPAAAPQDGFAPLWIALFASKQLQSMSSSKEGADATIPNTVCHFVSRRKASADSFASTIGQCVVFGGCTLS
jgi:hypothetical protein